MAKLVPQPLALLFLFLSCLLGTLIPANAKETTTIELTDPVYPKKPKKEHTLLVYLDSQGYPSGYSMELVNKVCLDDVCKLVEVTLYWDAIGYYQRLEYPKGKPLTKLEHDPFTPEDYKKLDSILKDRKSILIDHSLGFLATEDHDKPSAGVKQTEADDIDAVTRPTPHAVKKAVVKDAAWTTWVLWKYANTEIVDILQGLTEARCSPEYLGHLLDSKDWQKIEFALHYLVKQEPVPPLFLDKVAKLLPSAGINHVDLAMEYLQKGSPDKNTGYRKLIGTLPALNEYNAVLVIELLESDGQLEEGILEALTSSLAQQDYYPIHLALRLIESREFFSKGVEADIVKLLQVKDFFIARRASDFLSNQKLSASAKEKLASFREKHADRL